MNKKISSLLLLLVLSITDAYLLAHPNLIGKLGILIYKHSYIKDFPRALATVLIVVIISLLICEAVFRFVKRNTAVIIYAALVGFAVFWLVYVYTMFSSFAYRITGKAFIYGAHLLPVILGGMYGRYLIRKLLVPKTVPDAGPEKSNPESTSV
ncbi:hypothetical protein FEM33_13475 [Dyadobacter flavalbus]|uniref:Uncharacterized protein n=1 Tax=Dyadobacter flavalbus TaxID=2579942 RepID=A0A5M8QSN7_9BACT|nr:hypothetical protein [Dyadobacter flavalbus]KAA6439277.1 hypothetical protein FEM33_13475 [Dyadobacter flavalbus]